MNHTRLIFLGAALCVCLAGQVFSSPAHQDLESFDIEKTDAKGCPVLSVDDALVQFAVEESRTTKVKINGQEWSLISTLARKQVGEDQANEEPTLRLKSSTPGMCQYTYKAPSVTAFMRLTHFGKFKLVK